MSTTKTKPAIVFFQHPFEEWEQAYLRDHLKSFKVSCFDLPLSVPTAPVAKTASVVGVFVDSKVTADVLKTLPTVRLVTTMSTGFDHIDLAFCRKNHITVCSVPQYGSNTVAEHTFALILSLSRKIHVSRERTVRGDFRLEGLRGFDLKGKTIGLVGFGNIGQHVARIAQGFQMTVVASDPRPGTGEKRAAARRHGVRFLPLGRLFRQSDIISLHAPYTAQTRHLIDEKALRLVKPTALLINTARGGLVKTSALVRALQTGRLAGAGLDVLEEEQAIKEEKQLLSVHSMGTKSHQIVLGNLLLAQHENVIVTPHNAFNSHEALERILSTTVENIKAFYRHKPVNVVK